MPAIRGPALLLRRARAVWGNLAQAPHDLDWALPLTVVASPESGLCPSGWCGIVALGDSALATAPNEQLADRLRIALLGLPASVLTDPERLKSTMPLDDVLGPATLAYLSEGELCRQDGIASETVSRDHPDVTSFFQALNDEDVQESAIQRISSPAFVLRRNGEIIAAAGYQTWLDQVAHLSVITSEPFQNRGYGRIVASSATRHALDEQLLPQWRARPLPSRRVAQALGFRELGSQLSFRLQT